MLYPQQLSHGNVLTFTPPGFKQTLNVKFPDCRLAVCEKCKKNYKTRDMCRVRNSHTAEPWTTAYMCFTLDDNCTDENGKFVDKPLVSEGMLSFVAIMYLPDGAYIDKDKSAVFPSP